MMATSEYNGQPPPRKKAKCAASKSPSERDLSSLPYSVLVNIFKYLDLKSIHTCATLCTTLNKVSKDTSLYTRVTLKYQMSPEFLESFVSKVSFAKELTVEYKFFDGSSAELEDYQVFDKYVRLLLVKCAEILSRLRIESCRNDDLLLLLSKCTSLKELYLYRCKSTFSTLPELIHLKHITFVSCHFPQKIVTNLIRNCVNLKRLHLSNNININPNEICDALSTNHSKLTDLYISERKKLSTKSVRALGRLTKLKHLGLISAPGFECDPEDALEHIALGCTQLERLTIYGWNAINDDHLIPVLHMCNKMQELDLRGLNITIRSCKEAALSLPHLRSMDVYKCKKITKAQLSKLKEDFQEIDIPLG